MTLPTLGPLPALTAAGHDRDFALRLLRMLARDPDPQAGACVVFYGDPVPKGRPRHTQSGHTYTPKRTVDAERDLAVAFQAAIHRRPIVGPIALVTLFFVATHRRTDIDNLTKLAMDAATKAGVWQDDSQVVAHGTLLDVDARNPRTVIALAPARSGIRRPIKETPCHRSKKSRA